ncbi:MAG: addiction module protein [Fimbriiglobus sp.]
MTPATVLDVIRTWPIEDQRELANQLWDELGPDGEISAADLAFEAELDRRIAASEADRSTERTREQVMARLVPPQ